MITGDGNYIKKLNRSRILEEIIHHEFISRADLAKKTGLNKATISVQVGDLLDEELIIETQQEHHAIGRRPIMLSINGSAGYVLGIDLDYHIITYRISNLQGHLVEEKKTPFTTTEYETTLDILTKEIKTFQEKYTTSHYGLVQTVISVHGTVHHDKWIQFVPRLHWKNKDLKADIEKVLDIDVVVENNANLSTLAERAYRYPDNKSLTAITLHSGIGAGMVNNGQLVKGHDGYAGEVGHMIIVPEGKVCPCGNRGCWGLYASEPAFLSELESELGRTELTYEDVGQLLSKKDSVTTAAIETFIYYVSLGVNNIINLYNPETLIIKSKLLQLYPNAIEKLEESLHSSVNTSCTIVLSELGEDSCVLGACALALRHFFEIDEIIFPTNTAEKEFQQN
jgi:predicted NBD/HSP70 family sugar kinase